MTFNAAVVPPCFSGLSNPRYAKYASVVLGSSNVVMLHCANQPCSVIKPPSVLTVDEGKFASIHDCGSPGVGANKASNSDAFKPPSLSLSNRRNRSTKKRYPNGLSSAEELGGTSNLHNVRNFVIAKSYYNVT